MTVLETALNFVFNKFPLQLFTFVLAVSSSLYLTQKYFGLRMSNLEKNTILLTVGLETLKKEIFELKKEATKSNELLWKIVGKLSIE